MCLDLVHVDGREIVHRGAKPDGLRDRWSAGLELVRGRGEGGLGHRNGLDHLAAAEERRQRVEELTAPPQHTDPGRAAHLVPGEGVEVDPELRQVHRHVRHRLRSVDEDECTHLAGPLHDRRQRVDRAQHVGLVCDRDQLRPLVDQRLEVGQIKPAMVG
jgi:hypothetical protein